MTTVAILTGRGIQSALDPAGIHAERIARLWTVFLIVCAVVYFVVMLFLIAALLRRRGTDDVERDPTRPVSLATGLTVVILFALLVSSIVAGRGIAEVPQSALQISVTGHQWWWQIEYDDPDPSKRATSANEITIPVGVPVNIRLHSSDVIHSFWAPNLNGKRDMIPGHDASIFIRADRPGVYRGQCAEFCGLQHAKMALWINAVSPAEYTRWMESSRRASRIPSTEVERKGQEVFMSSPCPLCHSIQGTDASGKTGPDLTHFASRRSIAAATLPNKRGFLAGWILDPQHIKPGSQMPTMVMQSGDVEPLLAYLESLQ